MSFPLSVLIAVILTSGCGKTGVEQAENGSELGSAASTPDGSPTPDDLGPSGASNLGESQRRLQSFLAEAMNTVRDTVSQTRGPDEPSPNSSLAVPPGSSTLPAGSPLGPPPTPPTTPPLAPSTTPGTTFPSTMPGQVGVPPTTGPFFGPVIPNTSNPMTERFECTISVKPDRLPSPRTFSVTINADKPAVNLQVSNSSITTQRLVILDSGRATLSLQPGPDGNAPSLKVFDITDDGVGTVGCQFP